MSPRVIEFKIGLLEDLSIYDLIQVTLTWHFRFNKNNIEIQNKINYIPY